MKAKKHIYRSIWVLAVALLPHYGAAQFTFNGQLIDRGEFRHGYGKTIADSLDPALFISQRLRVEGQLKLGKLTFFTSIQDVRTWGSTSQLNISDNFFSLHEAWAHIQLDSSFAVKIGRQELIYDNSRFLGNVDWSLQGRSHDFALLKWQRNNTKLDVGAGFNQDGEALSGNLFTTPAQYKTAQLFRAEQKFGDMEISFLVWNNGVQYSAKDSLGQITSEEVRYMQTIGLPTLKYQPGNTTVSAFLYYQTGEDVNEKEVGATNAGIQISHKLEFNKEKGTQLRLTGGAEYLSGTSQKETGKVNHSYSPLFGTNHMYNGYMDMFYVGGRHEQSVGLMDGYVRAKYDFSGSAFVSLNAHMFYAAADVYRANEKMDPYLGTELDFTAGYVIDKSISVQAGYSHMFETSTLLHLQKTVAPADLQHWAYLMLVIRPNSEKKFIGLAQ